MLLKPVSKPLLTQLVKPVEVKPVVKPVEVKPVVKPVEVKPVIKPVEVKPVIKPVEVKNKNTSDMGLFKNWKPKTIAGKILKGATIGLGATALIATGAGAVAGAIGGGGLLAGAIAGGGTVVKAVSAVGTGVKTVASKVAAGAVNLVTGTNAEQREIIKEVKKEAKTAKEKKEFADKLMKLGKTRAEAMKLASIYEGSEEQEKMVNPNAGLLGELRSDGIVKDSEIFENNTVIYAGLGLLALLFLPKLLKRR